VEINVYAVNVFLHKPEVSSVCALVGLVSRFSFHDLTNLKFPVFCEVFLRFRICCQLYDNFGQK
jgi:hypothetical protein